MGRPVPLRVSVAEAGDSLYQSERKIYPREVSGRLQRLRIVAVFVLLGMFYAFPWLSWNGRQAVLFDLPARKFYVWGLNFWPQDFIFLAWLLVIAGLSLFFFTAVAGRLWCGYACPQTVWTEVFLWIEQRIEGDRNARIKLDAAPWSAHKLARKSAKQFVWIAFALWTGFTFVGFFTPIRELARELGGFTLGGWETFWGLFYALATYGNAGYLREQVCKYMCPYARFQSAMFDRDTLIIAYDEKRGEPRGRGKKREALGDCVDCMACVQVCPTGIDIRDGLQYECIACGACVDACDSVMDKLDLPRGLIRYGSENALAGKPARVLRPRVLIYGALLSAIALAFAWAVLHRTPLIVDVLRDRNALFRVVDAGAVENAYTLRVMNKDGAPHRYRVLVEASDGIAIASDPGELAASAEQVLSVPVTLRAPAGAVKGKAAIAFRVECVDAPAVTYRQKTSFFGPF